MVSLCLSLLHNLSVAEEVLSQFHVVCFVCLAGFEDYESVVLWGIPLSSINELIELFC